MYQPLKTNYDHSADQHKKKTYVKINESSCKLYQRDNKAQL